MKGGSTEDYITSDSDTYDSDSDTYDSDSVSDTYESGDYKKKISGGSNNKLTSETY